MAMTAWRAALPPFPLYLAVDACLHVAPRHATADEGSQVRMPCRKLL